jgi:hypothetical protein
MLKAFRDPIPPAFYLARLSRAFLCSVLLAGFSFTVLFEPSIEQPAALPSRSRTIVGGEAP